MRVLCVHHMLGYTVQSLVCYRNQRMSRIVNGSEFQNEGPEVAKLRDP